MGLFSKKDGTDLGDRSMDEWNERKLRDKLPTTPVPPPMPTRNAPASRSPQDSKASSYNFEDVMKLMRELPDSKKEMVIIIVQKTLMSAHIDIRQLLDLAQNKVDLLENRSQRLSQEIAEMERVIQQKKSEVETLEREREETASLQDSFQMVFERALSAAPVSKESHASSSFLGILTQAEA